MLVLFVLLVRSAVRGVAHRQLFDADVVTPMVTP
jgi:hypothetical protein